MATEPRPWALSDAELERVLACTRDAIALCERAAAVTLATTAELMASRAGLRAAVAELRATRRALRDRGVIPPEPGA